MTRWKIIKAREGVLGHVLSGLAQTLDKFQRQFGANFSISRSVTCRSIVVDKIGSPISRFNGDLLVQEFSSLLENKMAALRLATLSSTEYTDQDAFGVRQKRVWELFL